jgi:hypothetical protein
LGSLGSLSRNVAPSTTTMAAFNIINPFNNHHR